MNKYCIIYTDAHTRRLNVPMFERVENVKIFIEAKIDSGLYNVKDFRVFVGDELYVEKVQPKHVEVTLSLVYKGMNE